LIIFDIAYNGLQRNNRAGGKAMTLKNKAYTLTLESRGGQEVKVSDPRDRTFLKQADALVMRMNKGRGTKDDSSTARTASSK
jgi:hypothetical protein